jgi:hypothetical protein
MKSLIFEIKEKPVLTKVFISSIKSEKKKEKIIISSSIIFRALEQKQNYWIEDISY